MSAIEVSDLEIEFRHRGHPPVRAVAGASVSVEPGQIVGLVGESGCGKSTLAQAAVGLLPASGGSVVFGGQQIVPLTRGQRPKEQVKLQLVFQNPFSSLNPRRRVGSQIADGFETLGEIGRAERHARVQALLERVGLPAQAAQRFPHQFSGGQRQRIAIARALAAEPNMIILDEPLSALDTSAQAQIANLLSSLASDLGIALLLISHDLAIVRQIADTVSVMYLGVIVESGPTEEIWACPRHPYTRALIDAIPTHDFSSRAPKALPGDVPDPAHPPSGCRFHPRCPIMVDRCTSEVPTLSTVGTDHLAACWRLDETAAAETGGSEHAAGG